MGIVERAEENACAMGKIKKMKNIMLDGPTTWMLILPKMVENMFIRQKVT